MVNSKEKGSWIRLLRNERMVIAGLHAFLSPGLESRFTRQEGKSMDEIETFLTKRVKQIANANPWICGRIRTHPVGRASALWVPTDVRPSLLFRTVLVDDSDWESGVRDCRVGTGFEILNKPNEPPIKIRLIRSKNEDENDFIVTVCCAHVLGEPNLLYSLWGMLCQEAEIKQLCAKRMHGYRLHPLTAMRGAARKKFSYFFFQSEASPLRSLIHGHKLSADAEKPILHRRYVNKDWIAKEKAKYQEERKPDDPEYVSTQDVMTKWYFSQFHTSCAVVAYDMRYRVDGLTADHMGNYLEGLVLYPAEYKSPANIRRAVQSVGKWAPPGNRPGNHPDFDKIPSDFPARGNTKDRSTGTITGWHSRHTNLELEGCTRQTHLPLRGAMFTGDIPRTLPCMCLFKTAPDQFAVLTLSRRELTDMSALGGEVKV